MGLDNEVHDGNCEPLRLRQMILQCKFDSAVWFPQVQSLDFLALALAGEVGEVANLLKKVIRGSMTMEEAIEKGLAEEVVDVLTYLCNMMAHPVFKDIDWAKVWYEKREFNEKRFGAQRDA